MWKGGVLIINREKQLEKWGKTRQNGKWKYVVFYGLFFAGFVYLFGTLLLDWMFNDEIKALYYYFTQAVPFGLVYGFVGWLVMEKRYENYIGHK